MPDLEETDPKSQRIQQKHTLTNEQQILSTQEKIEEFARGVNEELKGDSIEHIKKTNDLKQPRSRSIFIHENNFSDEDSRKETNLFKPEEATFDSNDESKNLRANIAKSTAVEPNKDSKIGGAHFFEDIKNLIQTELTQTIKSNKIIKNTDTDRDQLIVELQKQLENSTRQRDELITECNDKDSSYREQITRLEQLIMSSDKNDVIELQQQNREYRRRILSLEKTLLLLETSFKEEKKRSNTLIADLMIVKQQLIDEIECCKEAHKQLNFGKGYPLSENFLYSDEGDNEDSNTSNLIGTVIEPEKLAKLERLERFEKLGMSQKLEKLEILDQIQNRTINISPNNAIGGELHNQLYSTKDNKETRNMFNSALVGKTSLDASDDIVEQERTQVAAKPLKSNYNKFGSIGVGASLPPGRANKSMTSNNTENISDNIKIRSFDN